MALRPSAIGVWASEPLPALLEGTVAQGQLAACLSLRQRPTDVGERYGPRSLDAIALLRLHPAVQESQPLQKAALRRLA